MRSPSSRSLQQMKTDSSSSSSSTLHPSEEEEVINKLLMYFSLNHSGHKPLNPARMTSVLKRAMKSCCSATAGSKHGVLQREEIKFSLNCGSEEKFSKLTLSCFFFIDATLLTLCWHPSAPHPSNMAPCESEALRLLACVPNMLWSPSITKPCLVPDVVVNSADVMCLASEHPKLLDFVVMGRRMCLFCAGWSFSMSAVRSSSYSRHSLKLQPVTCCS